MLPFELCMRNIISEPTNFIRYTNVYYKLYRFLTVYMGSYIRLVLKYTLKILYNDFIILQDVFLTWKVFFPTLYVEFGILFKLT